MGIKRRLQNLLIPPLCEVCGKDWDNVNHKICSEICLICRTQFQKKDELIQCDDCLKFYHLDHLRTWYLKNSYCPACKNSLDPEFESSESCIYCSGGIEDGQCVSCKKHCFDCKLSIREIDEIVYCKSCLTVYHLDHSDNNFVEGYYEPSEKPNTYIMDTEECRYCGIFIQSSPNRLQITQNTNYKLVPFPKKNIDTVQKFSLSVFGILGILFTIIAYSSSIFMFSTQSSDLEEIAGFYLIFMGVIILSVGFVGYIYIIDAILNVVLSNFLLPNAVRNKIRTGRLHINVDQEVNTNLISIVIYSILLLGAIFVALQYFGLFNGIYLLFAMAIAGFLLRLIISMVEKVKSSEKE